MRMSSICKRIFITRNGRAVCICICIRIFSATTSITTNLRHCRSSLNGYLTLPYPFTRSRRIRSIRRTSSFRLPLLMRKENLSRVFPPSALFSQKKSKPVLRVCDPGRRAKQSKPWRRISLVCTHLFIERCIGKKEVQRYIYICAYPDLLFWSCVHDGSGKDTVEW